MMGVNGTLRQSVRGAGHRGVLLRFAALAAVLMAGAVLHAADDPTAAAEPVRLVMRPSITVDGARVTLADVLILRSGDSTSFEKFKAVPVATIESGGRVQITHAQVTAALHQAGVNVGDVLLSGAAACEATTLMVDEVPLPPPVTRPNATKPAKRSARDVTVAPARKAPRAEDRIVLAEDAEAVGPLTLAEALTAHVNEKYAAKGATAALEFEAGGRDFLELTTPPFQFVIQDGKSAKEGLREFRVAVQQDGVTQRSVQLFARVSLTRRVVVANADLAIGSYVKPDDVTLEERSFAESDATGLERSEAAVGQRLKRFIKRGELVGSEDLRPEPLVQRSKAVTVLSSAAGVSVRLNGVALDNGLMGETVRVRIGADRGPRREARGVVTAVGTVRLED